MADNCKQKTLSQTSTHTIQMEQLQPNYCTRCSREIYLKARPTMLEILRGAAGFSGIKSDSILGNSKANIYVRPRYYAMAFMLECGYIQADVRRFFNKDHASVYHAKKTITNLCETDAAYKTDYEAFKSIFS